MSNKCVSLAKFVDGCLLELGIVGYGMVVGETFGELRNLAGESFVKLRHKQALAKGKLAKLRPAVLFFVDKIHC